MLKVANLSAFALVVGLFAPSIGVGEVWPGKRWPRATPESHGMSSDRLAKAVAYARRAGGGSGCVIRHGYLVAEWGDPNRRADVKSCTKGSVGATILGLAVDDGLVRLDDSAQKHYPAIGQELRDNRQDWLKQITIRHLATMTAGFDDGRPPKLVYRPGSRGYYSNDTSNMLAELLTLKFKKDLKQVLRRRVMEPLGIGADQWNWRRNAYRSKSIRGIESREFASGITITHGALARIGYLYLRQGRWRDRRILSADFIREATTPTSLPTFVPGYAFYWYSNAKGTYAGIPRDSYWALGLGDSLVLVCPSLDLVVVRLGVGSRRSHLPGGSRQADWGRRVAGFFRLIVEAVEKKKPVGDRSGPPYPPSPVIAKVVWAPVERIVRRAPGSDNWPITWGDDGDLYTAYGDGTGFDRHGRRLSLGLARIRGRPGSFTGFNVPAPSLEQTGDGRRGKKASGLLMVDGVLYLLARNAGNAQLAWSTDRGRTWTWCDWRFRTSFGCPTFLNFGKNYAGARDDFIYIYSPDRASAYEPADQLVLARVLKSRIRQRSAYEFFAGFDVNGQPRWSRRIQNRAGVFRYPARCYRPTVSFHPGLKRYLCVQAIPVVGGQKVDSRFRGGLGIYDAPEPWGPWTTCFWTPQWDVGPGETASIPTKWINASSGTVHLVFSGNDAFSVRQARLVLRSASP